ncbi:MAG: hypothetical protein ACP5N2_00870 [Candidatus Nanoarchaeia archaeon]
MFLKTKNRIDALVEDYQRRTIFLRHLEENAKILWKHEDDDLARMQFKYLEELTDNRKEIIESDSFRQKLDTINFKIVYSMFGDFDESSISDELREYKKSKVVNKMAKQVYSSLKSRKDITVDLTFEEFSDELKFSWMCLGNLVTQPRTMNAETYNFLSSASETEIIGRLFSGYCAQVLNNYKENNKTLKDSMSEFFEYVRNNMESSKLNAVWNYKGDLL